MSGGDSLPLRERGFISDTATAALVAADGTIDWYCPGRFDAPATCFRLLDPVGGAIRVGPAKPSMPQVGTQSYRGDTNLLQTVMGDVEVLDFMPREGSAATPPGRIVRVVTARRGPVDVVVDVVPGHAFKPARNVHTFATGIAFDGTVVRAGVPFDGRRATATLQAGERMVVTVDDEHHEPLTVDAALDLADRTATGWHQHLSALTYDGPYAAAVRRSLLVLKGLSHHDTGAVVAAPTTSLPERLGGERNWDYRFAWVRDASLAIDAAYEAGLHEEGERFVSWLQRIFDGAEFPLRPVYDVEGEPIRDAEQELRLGGWRRSQPVRIGNDASTHLQLDFYADVVAVLHTEQFRRRSSSVHQLWAPLCQMADWLCDAWRQPDRGIWEIRSEPRHLVSSKLACHDTLARMTELALARNPLDMGSVAWRESAAEILAWVERYGLAADGGLRQDDGPEDEPDASLLMSVWRGPWPPDHEIPQRTVERVLARLSDGLYLHRYPPSSDDGLPPGEGVFIPASFWAVKALARLGRWEEAHERMEHLVGFSRPLGLLPEEADPRTGDFLGNLPQAFSHLALVDAALALEHGPR
ncbi:MAG: hypothetical protein QOK43_2562 [Acidimicrobiaceae bacterium]|nr:hypothetical protein [Acidimicrobiaceae bacterium]